MNLAHYEKPLENLSIIFQGPILEHFTLKAIKTTRDIFPESELILSTYSGYDLSDYLDYVDQIVTIDDPGFDYEVFNFYDHKLRTNTFRMISTSLNGIEKSNKDFVIRLRSDTILLNREILNMYISKAVQGMEFTKKIMVSKIMDETYLDEFFIGDWFQMGLRRDLYKLYIAAYNLALSNQISKEIFILNSRIVPEYFLWNSLHKDFHFLGLKENYKFFINNNIFLMNNSNNKFILVQKYPSHFKNPYLVLKNISYKRYYEVKENKTILEIVLTKITELSRFLNYYKKRFLT